jgi:hypothetical protein
MEDAIQRLPSAPRVGANLQINQLRQGTIRLMQ